MQNAHNGIVYHKNGIYGDYDLENEEAILQILRTGNVDTTRSLFK